MRRRSAVTAAGLVGHAALIEHLGEAPVHDLDLAEAADHDVRRLQVAVDHALRVGVGDRLADLLEDGEEPRPVLVGASSRRQERRQRAAPHQLHRDEQPAVGQPAQLVDRHDARVLELPADLRLLDESPDHLGVVAMFLADHLDGQVAAEVEVAALEDGPHAPASQLADELISRGWVGRPVTFHRSGPDQRSVVARIRGGGPAPSRPRRAGPSWHRLLTGSDRARTRPPDAGGTGDRAPPGSYSANGSPQSGHVSTPVIAPAPLPFASDTESHLVFIG